MRFGRKEGRKSKRYNHATFRFAQLEFKHADSERAKTMFEGLVSQYPKRMDLWSVYADMMAKYRSAEEARWTDSLLRNLGETHANFRVIFERATSLKVPVQKLKSFYQKWLEFEKRTGTSEEIVGRVEQRLADLDSAKK